MNRIFSEPEDDDNEREEACREGLFKSLKSILDASELPHSMRIEKVKYKNGNTKSVVTIKYDPRARVMGAIHRADEEDDDAEE